MNVSYIYIFFLNLEFVKFMKGLLVIIERKRKISPPMDVVFITTQLVVSLKW